MDSNVVLEDNIDGSPLRVEKSLRECSKKLLQRTGRNILGGITNKYSGHITLEAWFIPFSGDVDAVGRIKVDTVSWGDPFNQLADDTVLTLIFEKESLSSLWSTWELIRAYLVVDGYYGDEENDEHAKIRRYWIDGKTDGDVAKLLHISASTVKRRRKDLGLVQERKKNPNLT